MKINGKNIKRGTIITVVSIIVLTLATMNVSYSSFFKVQTQNTVPVITAGNLNVSASITGVEENKELMPSNGYEKITATNSPLSDTDHATSTLTITNNDSINAKIGVSLSNTDGNATPSSVVIAIQKNNSWITFGGSSKYYVKLSQLSSPDGGTSYPIINDTIANNAASTVYKIYMWLASDASEDDAEKALNYSAAVKAVPQEGQNTDNTVPEVKTS